MSLSWCPEGVEWVVPGSGTERFPLCFFMVVDREGCCCRWCAWCGWARFSRALPGRLMWDHNRNLQRWVCESCHALGTPPRNLVYRPMLWEEQCTLYRGACSYGEYCSYGSSGCWW